VYIVVGLEINTIWKVFFFLLVYKWMLEWVSMFEYPILTINNKKCK